MRLLGIDEAGRGCALGDLFVASFLYDGADPAALTAAGAADSKRLSPRRRDAARARLTTLGVGTVARITPAEIDAGNLNELEERAIAHLVAQARPDVVVIDALGSPAAIPRIVARILAAVSPLCPEVRMAPGADRDHPVCGAASIFAKTSRDGALAEIAAAWGEVGSGYPSDPKTRAWLSRWAATGEPWPPFVRTRWGTIGDLERGRPQIDTVDRW